MAANVRIALTSQAFQANANLSQLIGDFALP